MNSIGADATDSLMEYLPPVGWADVVTKHDLDAAIARLDARIDGLETRIDGLDARIGKIEDKIGGIEDKMDGLKQDLRTQFYWTISLMVMLLGAFGALIKLA